MGLAGLFATLIGQDGIHAHNRFTFGSRDLAGGISLIPALVGAFGFSEILTVLSRARRAGRSINSVDSVIPKLRDVLALLDDDPALGRDRRVRRHPARRRRGHGGVVVVRRGEAREQGEARSSARARSKA